MTTDKSDAALERFYVDQLLPIARRAKAGTGVFPMGPDASMSSYYVERKARTLTKADFEAPSLSGPDELGSRLAAMWEAQGDGALAKLAPQLQKLAKALREAQQKQDDVSPFIYVMY